MSAAESSGTTGPPEWDQPNILNFGSDPVTTWTTVNAAEAIPGVQTPLAWTAIGDACEATMRGAFGEIGAFRPSETPAPPRVGDRIIGLFFGRLAINLNVICAVTDRIPGTSGEAMATQMFGNLPAGYESKPGYRHYPRVASRLAVPFVRYPKIVQADRAAMDSLWRESMRAIPDAGADEARRLLVQGARGYERSSANHTCLVLGAVQPAYDILQRVCEETSVAAQDLMAGHGGHEETAVLGDVWECSRERLSLDAFLARHGYHGPSEGDMATVVWREDPTPVEKLIGAYRAKDDSEDPARGAAERTRVRIEKERQLLAELPPYKRPVARAALKLGERYLPMRGIGKVAFLQGIDIARGSARRIGELLVADGSIDERDDVFMLSFGEVMTGSPANARELVAERRALYEHYRSIDLPNVWQGNPEPASVEFDPAAESMDGIAASPGVIEGPVRVVRDASDAHVEPGEILVARDTDPSWASLMFLSAGLIADIGGVMSHTAVVARELGIPCVVNTHSGTSVLETGDVVRMDGGAGRIEILERAASVSD